MTETFGRLAGKTSSGQSPNGTGLRLGHIVIGLQQVNFGPQLADHVTDMSDQDRAKAAKILDNAMKTATTVFAEITDMRQFTRPETLGL